MEEILEHMRHHAKLLIEKTGTKWHEVSVYAYLSGYCSDLSIRDAFEIVMQLLKEGLITFC